MPVFQFRLELLLDYRKSLRDLVRQRLAQKLAEEHALLAERQHFEQLRQLLLDQLRELSARGSMAVDRSASRRYFAGRLLVQIAAVEQQRRRLCEQIDVCRNDLVRADQAVKVLEKLSDKQRTRFQYALDRREALELEDIWSAVHLGGDVS